MKYYVISKFEQSVPVRGTMKMGRKKSYYVWKTPYRTKTEALKEAEYLKKESRAFEVTIEEIKNESDGN